MSLVAAAAKSEWANGGHRSTRTCLVRSYPFRDRVLRSRPPTGPEFVCRAVEISWVCPKTPAAGSAAGVPVRIKGQSPLAAAVYELENRAAPCAARCTQPPLRPREAREN